MLRLTETRGLRAWLDSFPAARWARFWAACWTWKASPVSSFLSVELCRFIPSFAAQIAVAFEPAPHQIRLRRPSEWGFQAQQPGRIWKHGSWLRLGETLTTQKVEEDLPVTPPPV